MAVAARIGSGIPETTVAPRAPLERIVRGLARLPMRPRRWMLRFLFEARMRVQRLRPCPYLVAAIRGVLQVTRREATQIARKALYHDALYQMEGVALASRPLDGLLRDGRHIASEQEEAFAWLAEQKCAVIATLHMGPYSLAVAWLLHRFFRGRKVIILRAKYDNADTARALERLCALGVEVEYMSPNAPADFHRLLKQVRAGAVCIALVDLPESYGKSSEVEFLWRNVRIANGVSDIAAICGAPMLLFRTRACAGRDLIEVDSVFEVQRDQDGASREAAARRIGEFVSRSLLAAPEQWHMWPRFSEYLPQAGSCPDAAR
jgi:lauroyl/myristoyl acyltransferase